MTSSQRRLAALVAGLEWKRGLTLRGRASAVPAAEAPAVLAGWVHDALFGAAEAPQDGWFVAQLEERTLGVTGLEAGFRVAGRLGEGAWVKKDGVRLWLPMADGVMVPSRAAAGAAVRVRLPCGRELATPGAYTVVARAGAPRSTRAGFELFVAASTEGALGLVEGLLRDEATARARFVARVATTPAHRAGTAALVLEVDAAALRALAPWVGAAGQAHRGWLRPGRHPLAWALSPGVSAAQAPAGAAFARHRSALVARGLLTALRERTAWEAAVAASFQAERLDWSRPWLGAAGAGWTRAEFAPARARLG